MRIFTLLRSHSHRFFNHANKRKGFLYVTPVVVGSAYLYHRNNETPYESHSANTGTSLEALRCTLLTTAFAESFNSGSNNDNENCYLNSYNYNGNSSDKDHMKKTKTHNFIADAVEMVVPSLVHIEVANTEVPLGSGFVVTEDGIIITNAHVVNNPHVVKSHNVYVKFSDGKRYRGSLICMDNERDLAAVKIDVPEGVKFTPAPLAKSAEVGKGLDELSFAVPTPCLFYHAIP